MTLDAYLNKSDTSLTDLAKSIGVSKGRLSQIRGGEPCPPALALKIETATDGAVSASKLSNIIADARKAAA
jgi:DNA-binding transcriptional regulator YdaS (Cro superfamily)